MTHSPEPWIRGWWEHTIKPDRTEWFVFTAPPDDIVCLDDSPFSEIHRGVQYGDEVHCKEFNKTPYKTLVAGVVGHYSDTGLRLSEDDGLRIVACVNACKDIPTEELNRGLIEFMTKMTGNVVKHFHKENAE